MENDIIIGMKITPRLYLTVIGDANETQFDIDKIISIETKQETTIVSYVSNENLVIEYPVEESADSITESITEAKTLKNMCLDYIKKITDN
jgi:hypothetical protein